MSVVVRLPYPCACVACARVCVCVCIIAPQSVWYNRLDVAHDDSLEAFHTYRSQCNGPVVVMTGCFILFWQVYDDGCLKAGGN